jgi:hypothetical protein
LRIKGKFDYFNILRKKGKNLFNNYNEHKGQTFEVKQESQISQILKLISEIISKLLILISLKIKN